MPQIKVIRDSAANLQCPKYSDSAWILPYEQLAGAAYALLEAERHGFSRRDQHRHDYHTHIRENVTAWIAEAPFRQNPTEFEDWLGGFYFNCAMQRLVATAEHLVLATADSRCGCGAQDPDGHGSYTHVWNEAKRRIEHLKKEHHLKFEATEELLGQMAPDRHRREMAFDPAHALAMMRFELQRRHSFPEEGEGGEQRQTWSSAPTVLQITCASEALALLVRAFNELSGWRPEVREKECIALGATA